MGTKHKLPQARTEEVLIQELPDETLVYDLKRHKAHCLNRSAALVWKNCDGQTSVAEMAVLLNQEMNTPIDEEVVWFALRHLSKANLLQDKVKRSETAPHLSRRELVRRIGIGAAIALPLIASVVAPEAAQAVSCVAKGGACTKKEECCPGLNCTGNTGFKFCVDNNP